MTPALLALNNAHALETSFLTEERLAALWAQAFFAESIGPAAAPEGVIIAFDQAADYDSPNFLWFRSRFARFVYVDRVIVAPAARGRGHARALYERLFAAAHAAGHERIACEVNSDPPNPASDAFHARMGFVEAGAARLEARGKSVRYLTRAL